MHVHFRGRFVIRVRLVKVRHVRRVRFQSSSVSNGQDDASDENGSGESSTQAPSDNDAEQPDRDSLPDLQDGEESKPDQPCKYSAPEGSTVSEVRIRTVVVRGRVRILFTCRSTKISSERQVS